MEKEDSENLRHLRESVDTIVEIMRKPKSIRVRVIEGVATGIGILGIVSVADVIRRWIGG